MPIRGEGLQDADTTADEAAAAASSATATAVGGEASRDAGKVIYVLHPNCAVEEM